jgi:hypothetical protein
MLDTHSDLAGLAQLHRVETDVEMRALWRRGIATLAALASEHHPVPLEGFNPSALLSAVRIALARGYLDDLGWLSRPAAAVALFELASALPRSDEKRELGRRVLQALHQSDAESFIALATALALGSSRALRGANVRARVALSLDLPLGLSIRTDPLALALISRRDSERTWLGRPSTGSLPSRRLAARILERAAREAARRYASGDDTGVRVFQMHSVRASLERLLADRESLVWRHAAAARGLLSGAIPAWSESIDAGLAPDLSPTEWRRSAASLAARIAVAPDATVARCKALLHGDLMAADRGLVAAMIYGLPCAADTDRQAAETLLDAFMDVADLGAVEALADLRRERMGSNFGAAAVDRARVWLRRADQRSADRGRSALREALLYELTPAEERSERSLHDHLTAALEHFAAGRDATADTERALEAAHAAQARLEQVDRERPPGATPERGGEEDSAPYREAFLALRELDRGLLETSTMGDLLVLYAANSRPVAERLVERLARWLLARETRPLTPDSADRVNHDITFRMGRLRALLHLVDIDHLYSEEQHDELHEWRVRAVNVLLARASQDAASPLRRALCATLARACDAVMREGLCELSDVLVATTLSLPSENDLEVLAEASMDPVFKQAMRAYVDAMRQVEVAQEDDEPAPAQCVEALRSVTSAIPAALSPRVEALRSAFVQITRALEALSTARSLTEMVQSSAGSSMAALITGATRMARLVVGACRHLGYGANASASALGSSLRGLEAEIEHAVRGDRANLSSALADAARTMRAELAPLIANVAALVFARASRLPAVAPRPDVTATGGVAAPEPPASVLLAPWLPPDRILGGFYILRTVDRGAVGSVFVACRVEERHNERPEVFALKVPEYGGDAAHTLSEAEFMHLFREEAQALMSLPAHPNLARFINFDAGARPKPILVMELVEGPTLERLLDREEMSVAEMLAVLDGVAAGLNAMHRVGIAHLDVKPSNIILRARAGDEPTSEAPEDVPALPVLVDFGLAGRRIRPGCATVYYGAPEVWSPAARLDLPPMPADVYAFVCMAFEMLTGELLFDGDTAVAIVATHLEHDGVPPRLAQYLRIPHLQPLMELFARALHPDPLRRADIGTVRRSLSAIAPNLASSSWPLV